MCARVTELLTLYVRESMIAEGVMMWQVYELSLAESVNWATVCVPCTSTITNDPVHVQFRHVQQVYGVRADDWLSLSTAMSR